MKTKKLSVIPFAKFWLITLGILTSLCAQAAPVFEWRASPAYMDRYSVIYPVLKVFKDGSNFTSITLEYQFNSSGWSTLIADSSPNPSEPFDNNANFIGAGCYLSVNGTFHLRAIVVDANGTHTSNAPDTTVNSSPAAGIPSLLCAKLEGYNYGVAWMKDGNTQRCWWTAQDVGGDGIVYADYNSAPPGTTTPTNVVPVNSYSTNLISNPSVIKYPITYNNHQYAYVMYVTEAQYGPGSGGNHDVNNIALSFSDNPGSGWTTPVKNSTPSGGLKLGVFTEDTSGNTTHNGAAIPSVLRLRDGSGNTVKWVMFNTDSDNSNNQVIYYRESTDGMNWPFGLSNITTVTQADAAGGNIPYLDNTQADGSNPCFTNYNGYWYMVYSTTSHGVRVYSKPDNVSLSSGSWTFVKDVASGIAMITKHNSGFFRDTDGYAGNSSIPISFANDNNDINMAQLYYSY